MIKIWTLDEAKQRAKQGIKFLDNHEKGWREKIELYKLDMGSDCYCILGQLYELYGLGARKYNLDFELKKSLGFTISKDSFNESSFQAFDILTEAWRQLLTTEV